MMLSVVKAVTGLDHDLSQNVVVITLIVIGCLIIVGSVCGAAWLTERKR